MAAMPLMPWWWRAGPSDRWPPRSACRSRGWPNRSSATGPVATRRSWRSRPPPHRRPTQIPVELENEIVTLCKHLVEEGLDAGPLTIQYDLAQFHGTAPGRSTIHRSLVRRGFRHPQPQKRPRTS